MDVKCSTKSTCSPYSLVDKARSLINSEHLSDICFLVGESKENQKKIYGHKFLLAMGSPVFEKMFFGDLAEKNNVIEIPDLTPAGFLNMIRHIYGEKMVFPIHELFQTYVAGNKYMVYNLNDTILNHLNDCLNEENKILVYDQFIKIKVIDPLIDGKFLDGLKSSIWKSSFNNEYFNKISQDILIDILSMNFLNVNELDVLKACIGWANESTIEDKRSTFKSIVPYINFSGITVNDFRKIKQLDLFLTKEDISDLFLFLLDPIKRAYPFESKTTRDLVQYVSFKDFIDKGEFDSVNLKTKLSVDHDIKLRSIETLLPSSTEHLKFELSLNGEVLETNFFKDIQNDKVVLIFSNYIPIKSFCYYRLEFRYDLPFFDACLSTQYKSLFDDGVTKIEFEFNEDEGCHCIETLNFVVDDRKFCAKIFF